LKNSMITPSGLGAFSFDMALISYSNSSTSMGAHNCLFIVAITLRYHVKSSLH
jgi:hypothetical protein